MENENVLLSIITVNYNGWSDTLDLLRSIKQVGFAFLFEVIVVDNGSKDDKGSLIEENFPFVRFLRSPDNLGFAGGNNLGISIARGEFLFFLNNDTFLPQNSGNTIEIMCSFLRQNPQIGAISPKIKFADQKNMIQFAGSTILTPITLRNKQVGCYEEDNGQYDIIRKIPYLHGAAMLLPRQVVSEIGGIPECYFLYYEELDWSCSIAKKYDIFYYPELIIYHKESSSTGRESPMKTYYIFRNRLLFNHRNNQGIRRIASFLYLVSIALVSNVFRYILKGRLKQAYSAVKGTFAFCILHEQLKK